MRKIRVLITDDSVVVRRMITDVLSADRDIEIAGVAANGRIALAKIPQVNPDIMILDVEMPQMGGLETLAILRKEHPRLPVIMYSTLTRRGAETTLDALTLGATDYVTKPSNVGSAGQAIELIRTELLPKIKGICFSPVVKATSSLPLTNGLLAARKTRQESASGRIDIVAIGISTGGPNALGELIPSLPADFPVPIVIVQHMPPVFTRLLAERLSAKSRIRVEEGAAGQSLKPGHAWIAPGDFHMKLSNQASIVKIQLEQSVPENSCRPAVDVLFRSAAEIYKQHVLAVVMTGMGKDGLRGCESVHEAGGQVLIQDEATSVVWGMPGFVAQAGLAEKILPLDQMGQEIVRRVYAWRSISGSRLDSVAVPSGKAV